MYADTDNVKTSAEASVVDHDTTILDEIKRACDRVKCKYTSHQELDAKLEKLCSQRTCHTGTLAVVARLGEHHAPATCIALMARLWRLGFSNPATLESLHQLGEQLLEDAELFTAKSIRATAPPRRSEAIRIF